jgi:hypothetical protein
MEGRIHLGPFVLVALDVQQQLSLLNSVLPEASHPVSYKPQSRQAHKK